MLFPQHLEYNADYYNNINASSYCTQISRRRSRNEPMIHIHVTLSSLAIFSLIHKYYIFFPYLSSLLFIKIFLDFIRLVIKCFVYRESHRAKQTFDKYLHEENEGNNLRRSRRAQRRVTCSSFFVTISSRHSSRRMRFGRSHSPTQNSHRTRFFHPSFFAQISISSERVTSETSHRGRSKFISNPPCGKHPSVEYFTLRIHSNDFSHCDIDFLDAKKTE